MRAAGQDSFAHDKKGCVQQGRHLELVVREGVEDQVHPLAKGGVADQPLEAGGATVPDVAGLQAGEGLQQEPLLLLRTTGGEYLESIFISCGSFTDFCRT